MANKRAKEIHFTLNDDDYKAFGRYRIMYTDQGHKMVNRQRLTYIISGVAVAILFTLFKVDRNFTIFAYALAAVLIIVGIFFAQRLVIRQQDKAIDQDANSLERVHPVENKVSFRDDEMHTKAGSDEEIYTYDQIQTVDLTEAAIYVWMSEEQIMPLPLHAFRNMNEMKDFYKWLKAKLEKN